MSKKKIAIILFNLGGPLDLKGVKPFLFKLFNDKYIISSPFIIRWFLAHLISTLRNKKAQNIYSLIGGKSPLLEQTQLQAELLEKALKSSFDESTHEVKVFISMRYAPPLASETIKEVKKYQPDDMVLLPLYPQYSTTTTLSSLNNWHHECKKHNITARVRTVCCYYNNSDFIDAHVKNIREYLDENDQRILFSAHGLPQKIVDAGDPYQMQVESCVQEIMKKLNPDQGYRVCYQSKVGPLQWLKPSLEEELKQAAQDKKAVLIVPISFVSEHSETLVELDIEYKELADHLGITSYQRVKALSGDEGFVDSLAKICVRYFSDPNLGRNNCQEKGYKMCARALCSFL